MQRLAQSILLVLLVTTAPVLRAQSGYDDEETDRINVLYQQVFDGDTFPTLTISEVEVSGFRFDSPKDKHDYEYYLRRVRVVYPYYLIAREIMDELSSKEDELNRRRFRKYKKQRKKELFDEFEQELIGLTKSQGRVLVKMINRQTGMNFHELIVQYNNRFRAWIYNMVANRNDYDLKEPYDPEAEENQMLELAIQQVENSYDEATNPLRDRI